MCKKILILGGTSDTEKYLNICSKNEFIISVATEYGYKIFSKKFGKDRVILKRFDEKSLEDFIKENSIYKIIDTTHPFAKEITKIAKDAANNLNIIYESMIRENEINITYEKLIYVNSLKEAITFLRENDFKKILLTIGSKMIKHFSFLNEKAHVRILPFEQSIKDVLEAGFDYDKIIAIQGPFSKDFNKAIIKEFEIELLVTKVSGQSGGYEEKVEACREMGIFCLAIKNW
ncbi:precorrin-6A reductase [Calditerrivibrio nitroreducens]|uniref:Precorrin-6x reductase n=1 Tax=Calditerrivibrio nitroreducens (strain DSM 19672 / NBRC 101217 / Yu37-1) TaxID=768670 RepID=E4TKD6_CALNY|nr:precorrin-6A reductase [Calditerrivibrio nitroreducens]ADR20008.1 precorrin-6x reductase [Calditerrivibrio nitroreducens DSM 19672]